MTPDPEAVGRELAVAARDLDRLCAQAVEVAQFDGAWNHDASAILTAVCKLYAALSEDRATGPVPTELLLSPTEACVVAAALLRSVSLTPFEFAIWFSGGGPGA